MASLVSAVSTDNFFDDIDQVSSDMSHTKFLHDSSKDLNMLNKIQHHTSIKCTSWTSVQSGCMHTYKTKK